LFFAGFLAFTLILMVFCRQLNKLGEILILLAVGVNACLSLRYMPFFIVAAIPFIYEQLIRPDRLVRLKYVVAVAGVMTFAVSDAAREFDNAAMLKKDGAVSQGFPIAATDFIIAANLQGNIFNPYQWGGYLLWRLAPERKIFQDSRALDEQVVMDGMSTMINMRGRSGKPLWQEIMDKYNIHVVILPKFNEYKKGELYKLTYDMVASPQWEILYGDQTAVVFQRVAQSTNK
jgi:hypothetical protein